MHFRIDFAASIPKDASSPTLNEDAWAYNDEHTCIALSDGASESFDSRTWAKCLVEKYAADQCFDGGWVSSVVKAYDQSVDFDSLGWAAQRAFDRGSFATLLGLTLVEDTSDLEVLCVGDSLVVHMRRGAILDSFPFTKPEGFDAHPTLVSTKREANRFLTEPGFFTSASKTWTVTPGDVIYIMTDAVGHWLLTEATTCAETLETLQELSSEDELVTLVHQLRAEQRMKLDDSTLIRLVVE